MTNEPSRYDTGLEVDGGDWLALHRNENLFIDSTHMRDLVGEVLADFTIARYPEPTCAPVREALAELYDVAPANIFVGNGSDEVLSDLLALLRESYDTLGVLDAHFKVFDMLADRFRYRLETLPGETFESGRVAAEQWRGLALVDSPNAITGRALSSNELKGLSRGEGSFLIWDNAYGEIAGDAVPPLQPNRVLVRTFSKFYGLASLRIGYCIADEAVVEELLARKDAFNVNGFAQAMALKVLQRRERFGSARDQLLECRAVLLRCLLDLGFRAPAPAGNCFLARHPQVPAVRLKEELQRHRIAVRYFDDPLTSAYIRITVPPREGIERLREALEGILASDLTDVE